MQTSEKRTLGWLLGGLLSLATAGIISGGLWLVLSAAGDQSGADAARLATGISVTLLALLALVQLAWISVRLIRAPASRAT